MNEFNAMPMTITEVADLFNKAIEKAVQSLVRFAKVMSRYWRKDQLYIEPWQRGRVGEIRARRVLWCPENRTALPICRRISSRL